jgi:hypothetical protein
MYGYRDRLMPYTRVYLPRQLATLFQEIHESEESLRRILRRQGAGEEVPVRIAARTRATRPAALDTGSLRVYDGNLGQISPWYVIEDPEIDAFVRDQLVTAGVPLEETDRNRRSRSVDLSVIRQLVERLEPREDDPGRWSVEAVLALIAEYEELYAGSGTVYVRQFDQRPVAERTRARLSGPEIEIIRRASPNVPALAILYWEAADAPVLWYPTLVLPGDMPTFIFGPT